MASDRLKWIRGEQERRRTERGRQRSEMMAQRKQGAQTAYMDRMAQRAKAGGATDSAAGAIAFGESRGEYVDRKQGYLGAAAQRQLTRDTGAGLRMQGEGARMAGEGALQTGKGNYLTAYNAPAMQTEKITGEMDVAGVNRDAMVTAAGLGAQGQYYKYLTDANRLADERDRDREQRLLELRLKSQQPLTGQQLEQMKPFKTSEGGWFSDPEWAQMDEYGRLREIGGPQPEKDISDEEADKIVGDAYRNYPQRMR